MLNNILYDSMMLESKAALERVASIVKYQPLDIKLRIIFGDLYDFDWMMAYDQPIMISLN